MLVICLLFTASVWIKHWLKFKLELCYWLCNLICKRWWKRWWETKVGAHFWTSNNWIPSKLLCQHWPGSCTFCQFLTASCQQTTLSNTSCGKKYYWSLVFTNKNNYTGINYKNRGFTRWRSTKKVFFVLFCGTSPSEPPVLIIIWLCSIKCHHQNPFRLK